MHGELISYRGIIEALILPRGVVLAADRGALLVVHGVLGVLACAAVVELLDPFGGVPGAVRSLLAVEVYKGAKTYYKGRDDQADYQPGFIDASTPR